MINIEQICAELQRADAALSEISSHLEGQRGEIASSMEKVQETFGSTYEGQSLVMCLSDALNKTINSDGSLNCLRSSIKQTINNIKK